MNKTTLAAGFAVLALSTTAIAAPGMMKNAEPMTLAQMQAKAAERFARMDVNGDGKIDQADRAARQAQRFDKLDTDNNGAISEAEYQAAHAGHAKGGDHAAMADGKRGDHKGHRMGGGMRMMRMADTNKDGTITRAEFDAGVQAMFTRLDTDRNGTVTPEERKAAHEAMRAQMRQTRPAATAD